MRLRMLANCLRVKVSKPKGISKDSQLPTIEPLHIMTELLLSRLVFHDGLNKGLFLFGACNNK